MLRNVIEYFIPPSLPADPEYQRRVRLVAYTIFITSISALAYASISGIIGFATGVLLMLCCFIGCIILLFLIKFGWNVFQVANVYGFVGSLSVYGCIFFSGGFDSPVLPWVATSPIALLLVAGKKSGYFWAVVSLVIVVVFGMMDYNGYVFPIEYTKSKEAFFFLSCHCGLVLIIFFISIVFENVRIRAHNEVSRQKNEIQAALSKLKEAQAQLIQSEKMASLGELTAGIAHEIQNPLNFVNNFSEVNVELITELEEETRNGNMEEIKTIVAALKGNEEKIKHHGKRADAIIKGMLLHSRKNTEQKEPTDINALCDEYLRLSYHGLRAKDKTFNADYKTDFDQSISHVNIVPQDIGRVFLNLFNNAFYAAYEKKKKLGDGYEPTVFVSTRRQDGKIEINVQDNGMGISKSLVDKIFQPFFTTKPAGQGTGLGLSLSYDIVKAHGGNITVESEAGRGTTITVALPV
jgi:signal transduction histidine kinase